MLQIDPGHPLARYHWGRTLAARGDREGAVLQVRKAVELRPSLVEARRELARLLAESRDWEAAVAELRAALAWEPDHARTQRDLAAALKALAGRPGSGDP